MGEYLLSRIPSGMTTETVETALREVTASLFKGRLNLVRSDRIPTTPQDDRLAFWYLETPGAADAMFSLSLLPGGRLEFRVPRWEPAISEQARFRRVIVRRLNKQVLRQGPPE